MKYTLVALLLYISTGAIAGEYCWNDKVTKVIVKNNRVFFTSEKSCNSWCEIDSSWTKESINQAFTILTSAKVTNANVAFYWNEHDSGKPCQDFLPVYSMPSAILLN
ncbi:hypothetical protein P886_1748 [Alteromonadaceae bacterium 2753L.S.0a.02]|nr:hypothetical protein P886_1748 [Alteromonadaceae bacterium 2753L.S.0a.02]